MAFHFEPQVAGDDWSSPEHCNAECCSDESCSFAPYRACREPLWTLHGGAIYLQRDRNSSAPLVVGNNRTLRGSDFDFDYEWGFEVAARRRVDACTTLELRYFQVDDWNESAADVTPASAIQFPTPGVLGVTTLSPEYSSELRSAEINLHQQWSRDITFLIGFRYLNLDERLALNGTIGGAPSSTLDIDSRNDLYGGQIGAEALLLQSGRWTFDGNLKAGVYYNDAGNSLTATGLALTNLAFSDSSTAFVGEIGIAGNYWLTERLAARVGYQLLWVEGVAVASDQVAVLDPLLAQGSVDNDGGVFYHGFFFGGQYVW